jgi:hypothetical protein
VPPAPAPRSTAGALPWAGHCGLSDPRDPTARARVVAAAGTIARVATREQRALEAERRELGEHALAEAVPRRTPRDGAGSVPALASAFTFGTPPSVVG